jgi:predicted dehydrogenase
MAGKDVVKVALVGLGRAGHFHMESVLQLPGSVRLAWVIDVDTEKAQRIAAEKGVRPKIWVRYGEMSSNHQRNHQRNQWDFDGFWIV